MNIIFFGTPDFVIPIADSLLSIISHQLVAVVTNPDRPVGRHAYRQAGKQILTPSPIKSWATQHNIPVLTPNILDDGFKFQVSSFKSQVGILAAYGKIIPQEVIDLFPKGILVIHPSLLPKYRGASPIQTAIFNGDQETGVSIIQMDSKMDHGPIVAQFREKIKPGETAGTLTKQLFLKTAPVIPDLIGNPALDPRFRGDDNEVVIFSPPHPQDHALATFTKLLTKDDGFLDLLASKGTALRSYNFIRAMSPWPGAWTMVNCHSRETSNVSAAFDCGESGNPDPRLREDDKRLKILKAHLEKEKLILGVVQLEGKKPVTWNEFQKGYPDFSFVKACPGREQKRRG